MEYCGKHLSAPAWDTCFLENCMQTRLRCLFRCRYNTVEGRAISHSYPLYNLFQLLQNKYTILKSEHQVRLICDSYAQVVAVTITHTLQLRSMSYFLVWQLRSIRRNFRIPISAISDPAAAVSHTKKSIGPMSLSMRNMDDGRGAVLTQSAKVCTHRVRRPPFWLIVTALNRNRYLPVYIDTFALSIFSQNWYKWHS